MIDLYASTTPNVLKIMIMLEETEFPYSVKPVNVWKGEQFANDFVQLNPNSKVPVIVDLDHADGPYAVFESAAILLYLAEKADRFLPASGRDRYDVIQWLVFQAANFGPIQGQFNHFESYSGQRNDYAHSRYLTELKRQYGVLEARLGRAPFLGGAEYSIADMATFPWVLVQSRRLGGAYPFLDRNAPFHPNIAAWMNRCEERPGLQRGLVAHAAVKSGLPTATPDDLDRIFGRGNYAYRT